MMRLLAISSFQRAFWGPRQAPAWRFVSWSNTQRLRAKVSNGLLIKTSATSSVKRTVGIKKRREAINLPDQMISSACCRKDLRNIDFMAARFTKFVAKASPASADALLCSRRHFCKGHARFPSHQSRRGCQSPGVKSAPPRCVQETPNKGSCRGRVHL